MSSATAILTASALPPTRQLCFHCGEICDRDFVQADNKSFCCTGCQTVYEILQDNNLCTDFDERAKLSFKKARASRFEYLDDESVRRALLQFSDGVIAKATFRLPQIHCASCIWLLENLFKINPAILRSEVNFLTKELALTFREQEVKLSEVVGLLTKLGYEPDLRLDSVAAKTNSADNRKLYLKIGLAGFAFGNVMLFSFPDYLDTTAVLSAQFKTLFAWLSIAFATPVLLYSASDYFVSSWYAFKQRKISLDVPVALGISALYFRSLYDIFSGVGTGYLDSFTGLVFFLLIGKLFQKKTFDALSFDRNYAAYFPLSVALLKDGNESYVPVSKLQAGDEIFVRNRELAPADSVLQSAQALIDYSFVTGESEPVKVASGDIVYAGGRVVGAGAKLAVAKEVSHSYLTQLWNHEAFRKEKRASLVDISDAFGKYFTLVVSFIAIVAALYWLPNVDKALSVFTAVLIIACPCALTLAAPFTLGAAVAIFGKAKFYLKNVGVVPDLAALNAIVFDKTGTLTHAGQAEVEFDGAPLSEEEQAMIAACLQHSPHPLSRQILDSWNSTASGSELVSATSVSGFAGKLATARGTVPEFAEFAGRGITANIDGHSIAVGSAAWIAEVGQTSVCHLPQQAEACSTAVGSAAWIAEVGLTSVCHLPQQAEACSTAVGSAAWIAEVGLTSVCHLPQQAEACSTTVGSAAWIAEVGLTSVCHLPQQAEACSTVHVAIDGQYRGCFRLKNSYRTGLAQLFQSLQPERELYLLSGDNDHERTHLLSFFKPDRLAFYQKPEDKLRFVQKLQANKKIVGMIGDGLNDAGALQQSNVGIALTEDTSAFTPACDAILDAEQLHRLPVFIGFARYALRVLVAVFLLSLVYNAIGLTLAVTGQLSPLVTAILMPLSSWSVVAVAWGAMKMREKEIVNAGLR